MFHLPYPEETPVSRPHRKNAMRRKTAPLPPALPVPLDPHSVLTDKKQILAQVLPLNVPLVPETVNLDFDPGVVQNLEQALQVLHQEQDGDPVVLHREPDDVQDNVNNAVVADVILANPDVPAEAVQVIDDVTVVQEDSTGMPRRRFERVDYKHLNSYGRQ